VPTSLRDELQAALGSAYSLERELGGGGMGRVFLATETGLARRVVIKVLAPELVLGVSAERFRREIELAASLQHPHIVPVHAAGRAGSLLYYTMPYVEGESLRGRLTREGELPVSDSVRILSEVARALAYAHRRGIVHRDIKPDNILLAEGEAQVTDFGIAKAISASASEATLTSIGLALGTPAYMAPEQGAADPTADHRVDLYALGVVAYEMLAGQPPFAGRTPQQLIAAHATEEAMPIERRRPTVPGPLADLIAGLLAKRAADRPQSADEVLTALQAAITPASPTVPLPSRQEVARRGRWLVAGGVAALALMVMVAFLRTHEKPIRLDRSVIAVAPFRVTGADSSLGYLREGMVDLLATKLSGTTALRPADPRTLLAAWTRAARGAGELGEDDAVKVAAGLGAARMVEGEVVGSRGRVSMSARIVDVPSGSVGARATAEGSPDSLTQLVDQLAATLLVLGSGESEQHLAGLSSTSLPALRAYLDGEALLRRGTFGEASKKFLQAYQIDSNFALAGVGAARAGEWGFGYEAAPVEAAWRHRDRLSPRDLASLTVYLGARYPAPTGARDDVKAAERFLELAPDSPDAWYKLADNLFHFGMLAAVPEALRRAEAAFARSLALDSTYAPAIQHLSEIATFFDDTAGVIRGRSLLHRIDSVSAIAVARQWHVAAWLGDTAEIRRALKSDSVFRLAPNYLFLYSLDVPLDTFGMEDLYRLKYAQAVTAEERFVSGLVWNRYELARGRPGRGPPLPTEWSEVQRENLAVLDAIFADGDSSQGARAARTLERQLGTDFGAYDGSAILARYAVGQYAVNHGNLNQVRRAIADLRQAKPHPDSTWQADEPRAYAVLLAAQVAARERSSEAQRLLSQLDSVLANPMGPMFDFAHPPLFSYANLMAARLHEEAGDPAAALAAVRRRLIGVSHYPHYVKYRREEGRLAALVGDTAGAIRAYRHYLSLRSDPELRLRAQRDTVRSELAALLEIKRH
jgi:tetratricopeptide (TPR) repeat protein